MLRPKLALALLVLILVGCRPDPRPESMMRLGMMTPTVSTNSHNDGALTLLPANKKILSDKVLTAMALERVTGRKPDPRRFIETR
jgi:ABC-type uncharacterized transport system auxiliary subunit